MMQNILNKIRRKRLQFKIKKIKKSLKNDNFTIISQNCIGGVFYHDMNMQFLSPTINLFFKAADFQKLIKNLKFYMEKEIDVSLKNENKYPIGRIEDIEVHFLHYKTCDEAKKSWETRKQRINYNKIIILSTDRDGFNEILFEVWKKIPYTKLFFTSQKCYASDKDSLYFPEYEREGMIPDLIPDRQFYKEGRLISAVNNINEGINV